MYPGWQIPQNGSGPLCGGIFWTAGERRLHSSARPRVGKMVEMRTAEAKMVEARMAGYLSQVVVMEMTAVAAMRVREVETPVQQQRYRLRE
jgi:hypothetical protein